MLKLVFTSLKLRCSIRVAEELPNLPHTLPSAQEHVEFLQRPTSVG
jgi:hypothetical protein